MKKSVVIITSLIYLLSIVIVAFLGYEAEIHNQTIYAEEIIMKIADDPDFPDEPHLHYINGAVIYEITYNESYDPKSSDLDRYKYIVDIKNYDYLYDKTEKTIQLEMLPFSTKGDVTNKSLSYYIDKDKTNYLSVSQEGLLQFNTKISNNVVDLRVSTNDGSTLSIAILIKW